MRRESTSWIVTAQILALIVLASTVSAIRVRTVHELGADPSAGALGPVTQIEPSIAIDPVASSHLVAIYPQDRWVDGTMADSERTIGTATSRDGGQHWTSGSLPKLTPATGGPFERATDPVVTFGPDGQVYALTLEWDRPPACRTAIIVQRSDDGGDSFGDPIVLDDYQGCGLFGIFHNDKGWITVDRSVASPRRGRVYAAWTQEDPTTLSVPIVLRFSDDEARTWSDLVTISSTRRLADAVGVIPLVESNGDLTVVYDDYPLDGASRLVSQTSRDGGANFDPPVVIADDQSLEVPGLRTKGINCTFPSAAVDPVRNALYVAWQDARYRTDGRNDIVVSRSTDGGQHWDTPRRVNGDTREMRNHFTPVVAAYDGIVAVTFRTRDGDAPWVHIRVGLSLDGGTTFRKPRRFGRRGDLRYAWIASTGAPLLFLGDYAGLAADADGLHAVWIRPAKPTGDSNDWHQTTWAARIEIRR